MEIQLKAEGEKYKGWFAQHQKKITAYCDKNLADLGYQVADNKVLFYDYDLIIKIFASRPLKPGYLLARHEWQNMKLLEKTRFLAPDPIIWGKIYVKEHKLKCDFVIMSKIEDRNFEEDLQDKKYNPQQIETLHLELGQKVCNLHNKGFHIKKLYARNIFCKDNDFYLIDLEEVDYYPLWPRYRNLSVTSFIISHPLSLTEINWFAKFWQGYHKEGGRLNLKKIYKYWQVLEKQKRFRNNKNKTPMDLNPYIGS